MNELTAEEARILLAQREGLSANVTFVGREVPLTRCLGLGRTAHSVWIWGPRRIGKTALAQRIIRDFASREPQSRIVTVDATGIDSFWRLLHELVLGAEHQSGTQIPEDELRQRFLRMTDSTRQGRPLLFFVDEFDRAAISLGEDEQGLLRVATTGGRNVNYVFVSHLDPYRLVEEVSVVASRLLGISEIVRVGSLERRDITRLALALEKVFPGKAFQVFPERVWDAVGGHPVSVITLAHALACAEELDEYSFSDTMDTRNPELQRQMDSLWRELAPATRAYLLGSDDGECRSSALADGFVAKRERVFPELLRKSANRAFGGEDLHASAQHEFELTVRIHDAILDVNQSLKLRGMRPWFETTDEVRRFSITMRPPSNEEAFSARINHLCKVVYESGRQRNVKHSNPDAMEWRIPEPERQTVTRSNGLRALLAYRSWFDHDPDFNRTVNDTPDRHAAAGHAFARACGTAWPATPAQWSQAHLALLSDLAAAFEELSASVRRTTATDDKSQ